MATLGCFHSLLSQNKHDYIWLNGYNSTTPSFDWSVFQFDFNSGQLEYTKIDTNLLFRFKANSEISDGSGQLQFYTNGCKINNRDHQLMENGDGLNPGIFHNNQCVWGYPQEQGIITLPKPGSQTLYGVFHLKIDDNMGRSMDLLYTEVDMSANNGLGKVTLKNSNILKDTFQAQLTAVRHGNGRDWWIIVPELLTTQYYLFLYDPAGIHGPFSQKSGIGWNFKDWVGQSCFSPKGDKYIRANPYNNLHIFDFDRCTGKLSNPVYIEFPGDTLDGAAMGVAVSPNNRFLYVTTALRLYQFDLDAADMDASRILIAYCDGFLSPFPSTFYQQMLAPDGKIYMTCGNGANVMHIIHNPNGEGADCNFEQHGLMTNYTNVIIPNFTHFRLLDLPGSSCDTLGINTQTEAPPKKETRPFKIYPNPASDYFFFEKTGFADNPEIRLTDATGKLVFSKNNLVETRISLENLPDGLFFIQFLKDGRLVQSEKLVILRL